MTQATAPQRTLLDVLRLSTRYLGDNGSDSARLDAELLCAQALGLRRLDLYLQFDRPLREPELVAIRALLRRRAAGEPVAYITGAREFYGRAFAVSPDVLIPRPDTETLVEHVLRWARTRDGEVRILDLGTGSGCIAVTLAAELPGASAIATDASAAALDVARANAARHGVAERVAFALGEWWDAVGTADTFDVVAANPPYITDAEMDELPRDVGAFEPVAALRGGRDGLDAYRAIAAGIAARLRRPALTALEVDPRRADDVAALLRTALPAAAVSVVADLAGHPRVAVAES